jgi:hypothetical protein
MHSLNSGNKYPKSLGYYFYFHRNLPKENNRPMGENSPNLVTLLQTKAATRFIRVTFTSISCRTDKVTPDVKKILPPPQICSLWSKLLQEQVFAFLNLYIYSTQITSLTILSKLLVGT